MAKKDLALVILGKKPKMEESKDDTAMDSKESKYKMAAEEILSAIKGGDADELGSLLKDFVTMCRSSDYEEEE